MQSRIGMISAISCALFVILGVCTADPACPETLQIGYSWNTTEIMHNGGDLQNIVVNQTTDSVILYFWSSHGTRLNVAADDWLRHGAALFLNSTVTVYNETVDQDFHIIELMVNFTCMEWGMTTIRYDFDIAQFDDCDLALTFLKYCTYASCGKSTLDAGTQPWKYDVINHGALNAIYNFTANEDAPVTNVTNENIAFYLWNDDADADLVISGFFAIVDPPINLNSSLTFNGYNPIYGGVSYAAQVNFTCTESGFYAVSLSFNVNSWNNCNYVIQFGKTCVVSPPDQHGGGGLSGGAIAAIVICTLVGAGLIVAGGVYYYRRRSGYHHL